jgi:hypothetical protein
MIDMTAGNLENHRRSFPSSLYIENKYFSYIFRFSTPAAISNTFPAQQKHFSASQHGNKAYFAVIIVLVPVQLLF